jgi:hypothetical protein
MSGGFVRRWRGTRGGGSGDDGMAIVFVLGTMTVLTLFLLVSLAFALRNTSPAREDQDSKTAVQAAQAGLEEYISRLNGDSQYWTQGNSDGTNLAFGTGQAIQGTSGAGAKYTYKVLSTSADVASTGFLRVQVTGTSAPASGKPAVSRTLTASLKPSGFLDYIYLSDREVVDPSLVGASAACGQYYYAGRSTATGCNNIQWTAVDTVNGPLHSNDSLQINGAVKFLSPKTESSDPNIQGLASNAKTWWGTQTAPLPSGTPTNYPPRYGASIDLPLGNTELIAQTTPGLDDAQTGPGCYYKGATRILFQGTTMKVLSPNTTSTNTPPRCLNVSSRTQEQTVDIPPVIYVDNTAAACTAGINPVTNNPYPISSGASGVGYPATNERYTAPSANAIFSGSGSLITTNYTCTRGTAYLSGTADDQVTVSTAADIVVTANLGITDNGTGTDVIGLISTNDVWVYHPVDNASPAANLLATGVTSIRAAILALNRSFLVQNWGSGAPVGTLTVTGAIAQRYRGPVGTGNGVTVSTGYAKSYAYDSRFTFLQPPYFLKPAAAPWKVSSVTDK